MRYGSCARALGAALLVLFVGSASAAAPWRWRHVFGDGSYSPQVLAVAPRGEVYVSGLPSGTGRTRRNVDTMRIDPSTGRVRWQSRGWGTAAAIGFTADGDPVLAGRSYAPGTSGPNFGVTRRNRKTGAVRWRYDVDGSGRAIHCTEGCYYSRDLVNDIVITPDDDVIAGGVVHEATGGGPYIVRLDGDTGTEQWRWRSDRGGEALVAPAPGGDVFATFVFPAGDDYVTDVARLAGSDASERWRVSFPLLYTRRTLQALSTSVLLTGSERHEDAFRNAYFVAVARRLDGATGSPGGVTALRPSMTLGSFASTGGVAIVGGFRLYGHNDARGFVAALR